MEWREEDREPVYKALNRPLTILGIERRVFGMVMTVTLTVIFGLDRFFIGLLVVGPSLLVLAHQLTKDDPKLPFIYHHATRFKRRQDPHRRAAWDGELRD